MATIVFSGGKELPVHESVGQVLQSAAAADRNDAITMQFDTGPVTVRGWFFVAPTDETAQVPVRAAAIAYVRP